MLQRILAPQRALISLCLFEDYPAPAAVHSVLERPLRPGRVGRRAFALERVLFGPGIDEVLGGDHESKPR